MSTGLAPSRQRSSTRPRRTDVVVVLAAYVVTRLFDAVLITRAAGRQLPSIWTGPHSGYFDMARLWDAQWYQIIAVQGYPLPLPIDATGAVQQNPWAFFPGFPYTVRAVMALTSLPFSPAAVLLNVVLGACLVVVLLRLLQRVAGRRAAVGAVVLVCAFPSAPVLQIAYSETLALLLLALAMLWLLSRRYLLAVVAVLALSLTRPVAAPFAVMVLAHLVLRWRARADDPLPRRDVAQVVGLGLFSAVATFIWPAMVQLITGVPSAYTRIQGAWRTGGAVARPYEGTLFISHVVWGDDGPLWVAAAALALVALVLSPLGRPMGTELRTWVLAYPAYLLAVIEPYTSTYRYAIFVFPLLVLPGAVRRVGPLLVVLLAVAGLAYQVRWVDELLVFTPPTDYPP